MGRYHSRFGTVTFRAGATTLVVGPGEGNFTISEMNASNKDVVQKHDRGAHDGWVETIDKTQDWSITIEMENQTQTSAVAGRIQDWLRKTNYYSGLTSVSSDTWAFEVVWAMNDGTTTSTCTLPENVAAYVLAEVVEGNTIAISGRNAGAPVWS